ncbi:MAG TPA: hypothetical protein VMW75_09485, partial [Thermoanaerobaculia bacterium]|nr:hypothetical protein [Thermoanaerobaculia bacterium]
MSAAARSPRERGRRQPGAGGAGGGTLMRAAVRAPVTALARTAIVLAVTAGLLALAEGATRLVLRFGTGAWPHTAASRVRAQQDEALRLYRRHPFLNAAPREGTRVHAFGKEAGWNALGYRSPERPLARP